MFSLCQLSLGCSPQKGPKIGEKLKLGHSGLWHVGQTLPNISSDRIMGFHFTDIGNGQIYRFLSKQENEYDFVYRKPPKGNFPENEATSMIQIISSVFFLKSKILLLKVLN